MRIWVDAGMAPRDAREIVRRAARRLDIEACMVTDGEAGGPGESGGANGAGTRIAEDAEAGDLVVTQNARLATRLVRRGIAAIDVRGGEYTAAEIEEDDSIRELVEQLRARGAVSRGPPPYDDRAKREFASALDRMLARLGAGE